MWNEEEYDFEAIDLLEGKQTIVFIVQQNWGDIYEFEILEDNQNNFSAYFSHHLLPTGSYYDRGPARLSTTKNYLIVFLTVFNGFYVNKFCDY